MTPKGGPVSNTTRDIRNFEYIFKRFSGDHQVQLSSQCRSHQVAKGLKYSYPKILKGMETA